MGPGAAVASQRRTAAHEGLAAATRGWPHLGVHRARQPGASLGAACCIGASLAVASQRVCGTAGETWVAPRGRSRHLHACSSAQGRASVRAQARGRHTSPRCHDAVDGSAQAAAHAGVHRARQCLGHMMGQPAPGVWRAAIAHALAWTFSRGCPRFELRPFLLADGIVRFAVCFERCECVRSTIISLMHQAPRACGRSCVP